METSITAFVGRTARGAVDEPTIVTSFLEFERTFGGLWFKSSLGYSVRDFFEQGGRTALVVRVHQHSGGDVAVVALGRIIMEAASPGAWGHRLSVTLEGADEAGHFHLTVTDHGTGTVETFRKVSLDKKSRRRLDRELEKSQLVRMRDPLPTAAPAGLPLTATAVGGNDGGRLSARTYIGTPGQGLYALDRADILNLIVIPPYTTRGVVASQVIRQTIAYAEERNAMFIMDPLWGTVEAALSGAIAPSFPTSANAAVYFPALRRPDPRRGGLLTDFPPAGAIAGMIARIDATHGVWKAPAGAEAMLDGVAGLSISLGDEEIERLNSLAVNCIRMLPDGRCLAWGAKTRSGANHLASEWKYVSVRRTALFIEESVYRGTKWAIFEPNAEPLWSRLRLEVGNFMYGLFRQGAFPGSTPDQSFFVECDAGTMTQDEIDQGRVNIVVGFAPVRPAEFVIIRIGHWAGRDDD